VRKGEGLRRTDGGVRRMVSRQLSGGVTHHLFGTAGGQDRLERRWDPPAGEE
jgi:hypothetical protein